MSRSIPSKIIFMCGLGQGLLWSVNIEVSPTLVTGWTSLPNTNLQEFELFGKDLISEAIIEFEGNLNGFMYASQFEMTFENDGRSKKELEGCTENALWTTIPRDQ